jgi:hypothetical protein
MRQYEVTLMRTEWQVATVQIAAESDEDARARAGDLNHRQLAELDFWPWDEALEVAEVLELAEQSEGNGRRAPEEARP